MYAQPKLDTLQTSPIIRYFFAKHQIWCLKMLFIDWWNAQPNIIGKLEFKDGSLESSAHKQKSVFDFPVYL